MPPRPAGEAARTGRAADSVAPDWSADSFPPESLEGRIAACRLCADRFAATATAHAPRPVVWFRPHARVLVASQAPGLRVHVAGLPFWDRSGDRLRDWLGVDRGAFYDRDLFAIAPAAFCFPGYGPKGDDLPPPPLCAQTWGAAVRERLSGARLRLLIGAHAQRLHLGAKGPLTQTVRGWRAHAPAAFPLPHPSWRNTAWLRRNPWFEVELLPALRAAVARALAD